MVCMKEIKVLFWNCFLYVLVAATPPAADNICRKFPVRSNYYNVDWFFNCDHRNFTTIPKINDSIVGYSYHRSFTLNLSSNLITHVRRQDFKGLKFTVLDLRHNPIQEIPRYAFSELKKLKELYITAENINYAAFNGLDRLTKLVIEGTNLHNLPSQVFQPLKSVREINIIKTGIKDIPRFLFANLKSLSKVDLSSNNIQTIRHAIFAKNPELSAINLTHNNLTTLINLIQGTAVYRFYHLNVSYNQLTVLKPDFLSSMPRVKTLDLTHNQIHAFPRTLLYSQYDLRALYLRNNSLKIFDAEMLSPLKRFNHLDLSDNDLQNFKAGSIYMEGNHEYIGGMYKYNEPVINLRNNPNLTSVDLSKIKNQNALKLDLSNNCRIVNISIASYFGLLHMEECCLASVPLLNNGIRQSFRGLNLRGNNITSVKFDAHISVQDFNLSRNPIKSIKVSYPSFVNTIDLSENNLSNVSCFEFDKLSSLSSLRLRHNELISLDSIKLNKYLKSLDVSFNQLRNMRNHRFDSSLSISELILRGNKIEEIENIEHLNNLKIVDIGKNKITNIPKIFINLPLEHIRLDGNEITKISGEFNWINTLKTLDLSNNKLRTITPDALQGILSLQKLYLQGNKLRYIPVSSFRFRKKLELLDLSRNSLQCSCDLIVPIKKVKTNSLIGTCRNENGTQIPLTFYNSSIEVLSVLKCNLCPLFPCSFRGTCNKDTQKGFHCQCVKGYFGRNCEKAFADCYKTQTCGLCNTTTCNKGKCRENSEVDYTCTCPYKTTGKNCETRIETCHPYPCKNGGCCLYNGGVKYKCHCRPNTYGDRCQYFGNNIVAQNSTKLNITTTPKVLKFHQNSTQIMPNATMKNTNRTEPIPNVSTTITTEIESTTTATPTTAKEIESITTVTTTTAKEIESTTTVTTTTAKEIESTTTATPTTAKEIESTTTATPTTAKKSQITKQSY